MKNARDEYRAEKVEDEAGGGLQGQNAGCEAEEEGGERVEG